MEDPVRVVPYNPSWKLEFLEHGKMIRQALGNTALRIDHIGSTAVEALDAKPIIDIQISVLSLEPMSRYQAGLEEVGFVFRADNPDRSKRYFRESPGHKRTHVHVREAGSWSEQGALLFRDFLRNHEQECELYKAVKYDLAQRFSMNREKYAQGKEHVIWEIMRRAHFWSQQIGWQAGKTDI